MQKLEQAGIQVQVKGPPPSAPGGKFSKDAFEVDLEKRTVRCPAGVLVVIQPSQEGGGIASFGNRCQSCALRSQCTDGKRGRHIRIHKDEATLLRRRKEQQRADWKAEYRANRPKVERKIGHLMKHRHYAEDAPQ